MGTNPPTSAPLHRQRAHKVYHKKLATFDIETQAPSNAPGGNPLYGDVCENGICLYGNPAAPDQPIATFFHDMTALLEHLIERYAGFTIAAHNGAKYEFNYLLDALRQLVASSDRFSVRAIQQGEAIIGYDVTETVIHVLTRGKRAGQTIEKQRHWHFLDTYPLFNLSLADVATAFCPDLPKLDGAVNWKTESWNYAIATHRAYLTRDCEIVFHAYRALADNVFNCFGSTLGRTAASTALRAFTASIPRGHVYYRSNTTVERFCRRAYRGGLVLPGATTAPLPDVIQLDMSGAYGYQMQHHCFPVGAPVHTYAYQQDAIGVYRCHVITPKFLFFGIIADEQTGIYPLGEFDTVCTSIEIEYARTLGYRFMVYEGYYWTREEPVFRAFMESCQALELEPGKKPLAKLLRNSLYGKFCTRPLGEEFHLLPPGAEPPLGAFPLLDATTGDQIEGVYSLPITIDAPYIMPIWGTLITAYQRVYVAQRAYALYEHGAASVYCDTDSLIAPRAAIEAIYARGMLDDTGLYGSWRVELEAALCIITAPKVYVLLDSRGRVLRTRAKGLPLKQIMERQALSRPNFEPGNTAPYETIGCHSIRQRLKRPDLPIRRTEKRRITQMANSPGWAYHPPTGAIRPRIIYRQTVPNTRTG